jgi:hypothetical protein
MTKRTKHKARLNERYKGIIKHSVNNWKDGKFYFSLLIITLNVNRLISPIFPTRLLMGE